MVPYRSIRAKLIWTTITSTVLVYCLVIGFLYIIATGIIVEDAREDAYNIVMSRVHNIETILQSTEKTTESLAYLIEIEKPRKEILHAYIKKSVDENENIYGICSAFEPDTQNTTSEPVAPYYFRNEHTEQLITENNIEYLDKDWYKHPKTEDKRLWSEPYYDYGGGETWMITYSVPFYTNINNKKIFNGVTTADIALDRLTKIVTAMHDIDYGYTFLLSKKGTFLSHKDSDLIMQNAKTIASERKDTRFLTLINKMLSGQTDFVSHVNLEGKKCLIYFTPVPSTDWTMGVVFPEADLFANVHKLSAQVGSLIVTGILLLSCVVILVARSITRPIHELAAATEVIAAGNFEAEMPPIRSQDEVGKLAQAFISMRDALKTYIHDLMETTAAKERIQSELNVARSIQMSLVPKMHPRPPSWPHCELYGSIRPAREVGGDLYDFFLDADGRLFFAVGDVSDKGVPAALFMAVAKTLLKAMSDPGQQPHELLERVNREISSQNDALMFITLFCGKLDLQTGELWISNAGHNPPLLVRQGKTVEWLKLPKGFVLGPDGTARYQSDRLVLQPGDAIIAYTDGVTEAMNPQRKLFSEARLMETVLDAVASSPQAFVERIAQAVDAHAAGEPQSDDITLLAVKYTG